MMNKRQLCAAVAAGTAVSLALWAGVARAGQDPPAPGSATGAGHAGHGSVVGSPATGPATEPVYGPGWRRLAPIAGGARQEHSVAAIGRDVYVIGGIKPDGAGGVVTVADVEVHDTRRDRWRRVAPLPVAMNHPNAAVVAGKLYILGGLSGGTS